MDPLLGTNFWSLFWDHIEMVPIEGPKNVPIIRDQILVPYRDHRMCGPLRTLIGPWSCFTLGPKRSLKEGIRKVIIIKMEKL